MRGDNISSTNLDQLDSYAIQSGGLGVGYSIVLFEYEWMSGCWYVEKNIVRFML